MDFAKGIMQWDAATTRAMEGYDFHMAAVRRGRDETLVGLHLAAAQRAFDDAERYREMADRCMLQALGLI